MTPRLIHADRPPSCVEPRPYTSESQRQHHYGDVQSMEEDEALLERIASYLPKLFWITAGLGVGGTVGVIAWHLGWFAWTMVG